MANNAHPFPTIAPTPAWNFGPLQRGPKFHAADAARSDVREDDGNPCPSRILVRAPLTRRPRPALTRWLSRDEPGADTRRLGATAEQLSVGP